jgi:hypothetical protein
VRDLRRSLSLDANLQKTATCRRRNLPPVPQSNRPSDSAVATAGTGEGAGGTGAEVQRPIGRVAHRAEVGRGLCRTFQRFVCRLFETLEICQLKFRSHEGSLTASRLAAIETALKEGDCLHDFLRLIRTIKIVVERAASLEQLGTGLDVSAQESPQARKIALDRMEAKMIKLRNVNRARAERREERGESD